jgi:hypothetical protein
MLQETENRFRALMNELAESISSMTDEEILEEYGDREWALEQVRKALLDGVRKFNLSELARRGKYDVVK